MKGEKGRVSNRGQTEPNQPLQQPAAAMLISRSFKHPCAAGGCLSLVVQVSVTFPR
jgi:hypothetical protein